MRAAAPPDDQALLALARASWSASATPGPIPGDEVSQGPGTRLDDILVVDHGGIIGCVQVFQAIPIRTHEHVLTLDRLMVHPDYRGEGIGSRLVAAAVDLAVERHARKLATRVLATAPEALAFLERHGFGVEGVLLGEYVVDGQDVDDVILCRWLAGDS